MARAVSSIEHMADKDLVDADLLELIQTGKGSIRSIAARWGIAIATLHRRKRNLEAAQGTPVAPTITPEPAPAPILQPVASSPTPVSQPPATYTIIPDDPTPDADEVAGNDAHIARLRQVQMLRFRQYSNAQIAKLMNKSVRTIERWVAAAKKLRSKAIAGLDIGAEYSDAVAFLQHTRAQILKNGDECLSSGDRLGHRLAQRDAARIQGDIVACLDRLIELGIVRATPSIAVNEEVIRENGVDTYRRIMQPVLEELEAQLRRDKVAAPADQPPADQPKETTDE
jgi:transposase-like protein